MTDPIADLLNRIRNAQAVLKPTVEVPFSNFTYELASILEKNGFIERIEKKGKMAKRFIEITLKYSGKTPIISGLKRISKPGRKIYLKRKKIKPAREGYGISIVSTSKGLMTDKEAKRARLGGEIIAEIW